MKKGAALAILLALPPAAALAAGGQSRALRVTPRAGGTPAVTFSPSKLGDASRIQGWKPGMSFAPTIPTLPDTAIPGAKSLGPASANLQAAPEAYRLPSPAHQGLVEALPLLEGDLSRPALGARALPHRPEDGSLPLAETLEEKAEAMREPLSTLSRAARGAASDEEVLGAGRRVEEILLGVSRASASRAAADPHGSDGRGYAHESAVRDAEASTLGAAAASLSVSRLPSLPPYAGFASAEAMSAALARLGAVPAPAARASSDRGRDGSLPLAAPASGRVARLVMDVVWPDALAFAQVSAEAAPASRLASRASRLVAAAALEGGAPSAASRSSFLAAQPALESPRLPGDLELFTLSAAFAAQNALPPAASGTLTPQPLSRPASREPLAAHAFLALLFLGLAPLAVRRFQP